MQTRYIKNIDTILTEDIQSLLLTKKIAVIGCGGQGSYLLDFLARLGVSEIYFWDGDNYEESNLNRQLGCTLNTIGENKAITLKRYLETVNDTIIYHDRDWYFGDKDDDLFDILNCDCIIMAADGSHNPGLFRDIIKLAIERGIPCIDEAVQGMGGFISIVTNKDLSFWDNNTNLWLMQSTMPLEVRDVFSSQPSYKCALIAAECINQMVKYFSENKYCALNSKLEIDLYHNKYREYDKYGFIY